MIDTLIIGSSQLLTLKGKEGISTIINGGVAIKDGRIFDIDTTHNLLEKYSDCPNIVDAKNSLVMPGFVDCHTHLVFGGSREEEMEMRLNGSTYLEIHKAGGGLYSTVNATRALSKEDLLIESKQKLKKIIQNGTTSLEIKSGYGLNYNTEKKILQIINQLSSESPIDIVSTYLGAHSVPKETDRREYINWLKGKSLSEFKKYAKYFDIFCEDGAYSLDETKELLEAAKSEGYELKIHSGQFNDLGATGVASELGAISADHLENIDDDQIELMAKNSTVAVLMPGVPFFLKSKYPDGRKLIDRGVSVALATDFNPGSCPSYSMQMMITLAVFNCGLTITEAIRAATINSAKAIGLENSVGSLEVGKKADIIFLSLKSSLEIPYFFGTNLVTKVFKNGEELV